MHSSLAALGDREAWSDELHKLLSDPRILEERTDRIRKIHHKRTWAEVSRALMAL